MIITISIGGQGSSAFSFLIFAILGTDTECRRGILAHTMMLKSVITIQLSHVSVKRCIRRPDLVGLQTITSFVLIRPP